MADDKKKGLERSVADLETTIEEMKVELPLPSPK